MTDRPTNQPTDGHEGSLGSYTSIIVIIVRTSHILKACDIIGLVNATMTPIILRNRIFIIHELAVFLTHVNPRLVEIKISDKLIMAT